MRNIILITLLMTINSIKSQSSVGYQYDANGNRTQRLFIGLTAKFNSETSKDSTAIIQEQMKTALNHGLSIYPNPTRDAVTLSLNKAGEDKPKGNATAFLLDNSGKVIAQQNYSGNEISFDLSTLAPGNYYIRIKFEKEESVVYKVIKVN